MKALDSQVVDPLFLRIKAGGAGTYFYQFFIRVVCMEIGPDGGIDTIVFTIPGVGGNLPCPYFFIRDRVSTLSSVSFSYRDLLFRNTSPV